MRSPSKLLRMAALVAVGSTAVLSAHAALSTAGAGTVEFRAVGPAGLTIDGQGGALTAKEAGGLLTLEVPVSELKTGISLRDDHLKKALDTSAHPRAVFVVDRSKLKFPADNQELESQATGQLTLHGVTKPSTITYKVKRTGSDFHVQGRFEVDINAYGIETPCYLGVCVQNQVKVKAKFKLREG